MSIPKTREEYKHTSYRTDTICNGGIMPLRNGEGTSSPNCLRAEDINFLIEAIRERDMRTLLPHGSIPNLFDPAWEISLEQNQNIVDALQVIAPCYCHLDGVNRTSGYEISEYDYYHQTLNIFKEAVRFSPISAPAIVFDEKIRKAPVMQCFNAVAEMQTTLGECHIEVERGGLISPIYERLESYLGRNLYYSYERSADKIKVSLTDINKGTTAKVSVYAPIRLTTRTSRGSDQPQEEVKYGMFRILDNVDFNGGQKDIDISGKSIALAAKNMLEMTFPQPVPAYRDEYPTETRSSYAVMEFQSDCFVIVDIVHTDISNI